MNKDLRYAGDVADGTAQKIQHKIDLVYTKIELMVNYQWIE